jgi:tetratricopeptide (TPR) repeat protein
VLPAQLRNGTASIAAAALFLTVAIAHGQEKKVKDQKEYDLYTAATNPKETDPNKKIQYLLQWEKEYPDSDFKLERQQLIATTYYQGLRKADEAWKASEKLLAMDPKSFVGLYFITSLVISMNVQDPARLDTGEKAARGLIENLDSVFGADKKPQQVSEADWKKQRLDAESLAVKTIGWIQMQRKDWKAAEETFVKFLRLNPNSGWISYWLSTTIFQQKVQERQIEALYHLARAANYTGPDELPAETKKQLSDYLRKTYISYHGDSDGLNEVIQLTLKNPFPPSDFKIESKAEKEARLLNELRETDPGKYLWLQLKKGITPEYFEMQLKGSALPKLKGKVVSATPEAKPKTLGVAILGEDEEIRLVLETAHGAKIDPGTVIEFEGGVAKEWTQDPFLLTLDPQENEKITGLPEPPKRAPAKRGTTKRKKK